MRKRNMVKNDPMIEKEIFALDSLANLVEFCVNIELVGITLG